MNIKNSFKDKNKILKIKTFREGPFYFSALYDELTILPLLREAEVRYESIRQIPLLPELSAQLEKDLIRKSIFGTAAIEGNPLSEKEVEGLLDQALLPFQEETKKTAQQEIANLNRIYAENLSAAYGTLDAINADNLLILHEDFIKFLHKGITENILDKDNVPGQYRKNLPGVQTEVGDEKHGGRYRAPRKIEDIKTLMRELIGWMQSDEMRRESPFIRAALIHYYFAKIHPFGNGNGRTARVIEAFLLKKAGFLYLPYALSNYYYRRIDDYYWAFSKTHKDPDHAVTEFIAFVLKAINVCLEEIQSDINNFTRKTILSDYYNYLRRRKEINRKTQKILNILLEDSFSFDLKRFRFLYGSVSEITGRRHIKKLLDLKLIKEKKDTTGRTKVYELNLDVLN